MRWRRTMTGLGCAVSAVVLVSCATPSYNQNRLQSQLVHAGATPDEARCVTKGLTDTFDENQLGSHSKPEAEELEKARGILAKCGVKLPLQPR